MIITMQCYFIFFLSLISGHFSLVAVWHSGTMLVSISTKLTHVRPG